MRKSVLIAAAFASLAAVLPTTVATASPPIDIQIVIDTTIIPPTGGEGRFTASGSAVVEKVFCASGYSQDVFSVGAGQAQGENYQVLKELKCDDGGSVLLKMQVRIDRKGNNYSWIIVDGDGAYERLRGSGQGSGAIIPESNPLEIDDHLTGGVHVD